VRVWCGVRCAGAQGGCVHVPAHAWHLFPRRTHHVLLSLPPPPPHTHTYTVCAHAIAG
jgi:hypothetical protein